MTDYQRMIYGGYLCKLDEDGVYPDEDAEIAVIDRARLRGYEVPDQSKRRPGKKGDQREKA